MLVIGAGVGGYRFSLEHTALQRHAEVGEFGLGSFKLRAGIGGGFFHIGMKTGNGEARDHLDRKYTFVGEDELRGLLVAAGFEIMAQDTGHEVGLAGTDDWWIVLMAQKKADTEHG